MLVTKTVVQICFLGGREGVDDGADAEEAEVKRIPSKISQTEQRFDIISELYIVIYTNNKCGCFLFDTTPMSVC